MPLQRSISALLVTLLIACHGGKALAKNVDIVEADIETLQQSMATGALTSVQLVQQYLARIEAYDQHNTALNALIRLNSQALERAAALDEERRQTGPRGPLHGIPIIVKDNFNTAGLATSAGSIALAGFVPTHDAFLIEKLKDAGAIILAKANMDELAAGGSGLSALGGQTRNPYDLTRSPGGSSAGTAVAIAANFATVGLGTDTCGSIRIPSSFNGLVGFRPSKGLASVNGIIPLWQGDDMGGPMTRSVRDAATVMDFIAGFDPGDPATRLVQNRDPGGFLAGLEQADLKTARLGRLTNYFDPNTESAANQVLSSAIERLEQQGATLVDIDTRLFDQVFAQLERKPPFVSAFKADLEAYFQTNPGSGLTSPSEMAELGLYHERLDSGSPFREMVGAYPPALQTALKAKWKRLLNEMIEQVLAKHNLDAFIYPTVNVIPPVLGEQLSGYHCALSAISGTPALTVPAGFTPEGVPVGLELLGPKGGDQHLLAMGYAVEQMLDARRSPATTPPLVESRASSPISFTQRVGKQVDVTFTFDPTRSELHYQTRYLDESDIYAVCLHKAKRGPVIQCLSGINGRRSSGSVTLNASHRQAFYNNQFVLRLYSSESPKGQLSEPVVYSQAHRDHDAKTKDQRPKTKNQRQ